jgi:ribose-phosphate pyrophosphokinase
MAMPSMKIFSGSSHPELTQKIAKYLKMKVSDMVLTRFACNEVYARPKETVRGCDVYVVQTATQNVNEDLMELFVILDALKRSFAGKIHVVMPHYAYSRQDRVAQPREPISAKLVADLISAAGSNHVITIALHSDQEQGFFDYPVDNLSADALFAGYFKKKKLTDVVVVSPDVGGTKCAKKFADFLGADLAILHKIRPRHNVAEVKHIIGDVKNKTCIIYDDMIDTAGTVCEAQKVLKKSGAKENVFLVSTHAVFSHPAIARLQEARFKEVVVTDTIPIQKEKRFSGLTVLSIAELLAKTIRSVHFSRSVTSVIQ